MPDLIGGDPRFRADEGTADPAVAGALAAFGQGAGTEHEVLVALASARLLIPVIAIRADELVTAGPGEPVAAGQGEKATEMATPAIIGRDGRRALPAFTTLQALQRWQPDARPVPVPASAVWQAAVKDSQAVIIDIAGPVPLVVDGARLSALAGGTPVPHLHEDADVQAAVAAVAASQPPGIRIRLGPPEGGADFTLELSPADPAGGLPVTDAIATAIAEAVADRLAGRLVKGIAVLVS